MALSANREVQFYSTQELIDAPADDNVKLYKGAFVGVNASTGYVRPLVAGDAFAGVAYKQADNTITGHVAGGIRARLHQRVDIVHALSGAAQTNVGALVYASADDALTLTASGNSLVGRIVALEGANLVRVRCQPVFGR